MALTGSADKTIRLWNLNTNECTKSIDAHSDCVRDIKLINNEQFLSCSNDATIKRWNLNGDLLEQYDGHENYIYSITLISNDLNKFRFASCSEDKTLRIWSIGGKNQQSIRIPSQTLWSISKLKNNDLIVGCSNGKIYIYTQNESLQAPDFLKNEIKEEVAKTNLHMNELGDIKVDKLPNKDALNLPGKKEGETKLIKDGETIIAYQWDSSKYEWVKIGDVVGTANSNKDPSQKQEYEGKLYDFVFSVDIKEGSPPLKLPYNIDQNPYMVAQQFIDKHELTQAYLDEIANFIVKNSQVNNTIQQQPLTTTGADPFTGSSSYRPESNDNLLTANTELNLINDYYPLKNYFLFETINLDGITKKLKEFGRSIESVELQITTDDVKSLLNLTDLSKPINDDQMEIIKKILRWPQNNLFPVLDFVRMAVLIPKISSELCNEKFSNTFLDILLQSAVNQNSTPNQYLSLRCICNLFKNNEQFVKNYGQIILSKTNQCLQSGNKSVQIALSTLYMNYSLLFGKSNDGQDLKTELALNSIQMLQTQFDPESQFRALVTIGTVVEQDKYLIDLIRSEDLFKSLQKLSNNSDKLGKCAQFLKTKIKG